MISTSRSKLVSIFYSAGRKSFDNNGPRRFRNLKSQGREPFPHHLGFLRHKEHGSFNYSPKFTASPSSGHDPTDRMRIRSQQHVANFMCEYMAQKCRRESPRFRHLLNPVIKGIPVVTHAFLIQRSRPEHIGTISHLHAHRARKDLKHQISGTNNVAARRLSILSSLGAVPPKRLYASLLKNPMYLRLGRSQEFCRNVGVVVDRDVDFRQHSLCCRCSLIQARGGQKAERQNGINANVAVHSVTSKAMLLSANRYLNAPQATSWASIDGELNCLKPVVYERK